MKKFSQKAAATLLSLALLTPSSQSRAAAVPDDFNSFMKDALSDFDNFIDEANRDFINFMRNPWKKHQAEKPVEKRVVPEPVKPVLFDSVATPPSQQAPTQLTIEEILGQATTESKQKPTVTVNVPQGDKIPREEPKPTKPATPAKPSAPTKPSPPSTPSTPTTPVKPAAPVKPSTPATPSTPSKPTTPSVPSTPAKPAKPTSPIPTPPEAFQRMGEVYSGGTGRTPITYGGITYYVSNGLKNSITLNGLSENAIADAYEELFRADWQPVINDLKQLRKGGLNNDWALFMFIKQVAESFTPSRNASMVMRQFLLNQLGYKARMAKVPSENRLSLLTATDTQLYGVIFLDIKGTRYYDVDARNPYAMMICEKDAPSSKNLISMQIRNLPDFGKERKTSTHATKSGQPSVSVSVSKPQMDFYMKMPQCDYSVYAQAKVDPAVAITLLRSLKPAIEGKGEREAANLLLDYVQNAFAYATDDEQFGFEKPFFVEELFYYPSCDCEDRSILYRYLVKNLLGLDVVLVDYPNHIATAVKFNENVKGDYLMVDGAKYVVCDPTFIGAPVGMAMPSFRNVQAKVLKY